MGGGSAPRRLSDDRSIAGEICRSCRRGDEAQLDELVNCFFLDSLPEDGVSNFLSHL